MTARDLPDLCLVARAGPFAPLNYGRWYAFSVAVTAGAARNRKSSDLTKRASHSAPKTTIYTSVLIRVIKPVFYFPPLFFIWLFARRSFMTCPFDPASTPMKIARTHGTALVKTSTRTAKRGVQTNKHCQMWKSQSIYIYIYIYCLLSKRVYIYIFYDYRRLSGPTKSHGKHLTSSCYFHYVCTYKMYHQVLDPVEPLWIIITGIGTQTIHVRLFDEDGGLNFSKISLTGNYKNVSFIS